MIKQKKLSENFFNHFLKDTKLGSKTTMKSSDFIFDCVNLLNQKCDKIDMNRGGSCRDFPYWMKTIKATIIPFNDDNTCFQYAATH